MMQFVFEVFILAGVFVIAFFFVIGCLELFGVPAGRWLARLIP